MYNVTMLSNIYGKSLAPKDEAAWSGSIFPLFILSLRSKKLVVLVGTHSFYFHNSEKVQDSQLKLQVI